MMTCLTGVGGLISVLLSAGYGRYDCGVWKLGVPAPGDTHVCVTIGSMSLPDCMGTVNVRLFASSGTPGKGTDTTTHFSSAKSCSSYQSQSP